MRKFKHKITEKIVKQTPSMEFYSTSSEVIPAWVIENSNDWEEIVEKDYEILMYRGKINTDIYFDNPEYFSRLNSDWEIYSVRRKSDGVEFKIGDRVCWGWYECNRKYFTIKSFKIDVEGGLRFNTVEPSGQNFNFSICNIQHYKEPILTTEDGYECTLDDRVFGVLPKGSWETNYYGGEGIPVHLLLNSEDGNCLKTSSWLYFKTKENAEKYIYDNKPEFSRKQILELYEKLKVHTFSYWNILLDEMLLKKGD